jgi:hypothetical protein
MKRAVLVFSVLSLVGCASTGPVLYPNAHLKSVGRAQANRDIAECRSLADAYVKSDAGKKAARETAAGAAEGAVIGGAAGAVTRDFGRGVGVGAAAGGARGLVQGISKASDPPPLYKNFVDQCLKEKGYEPIGWQ